MPAFWVLLLIGDEVAEELVVAEGAVSDFVDAWEVRAGYGAEVHFVLCNGAGGLFSMFFFLFFL